MRFSHLVCLILASLLSSSAVAAQDEPRRDPRALEVLQASLLATGGASALTSVVAQGTLTRFDLSSTVSVPVEVKADSRGRVRWDYDRSDGRYTATTAAGGGRLGTPRGTSSPIPLSRVSGQMQEVLPLFMISRWLADGRVDARYLGTEEIGGTQFHRIEIRRALDGDHSEEFRKAFQQATRVEVYVSTDTFLPARVRYFEHPGDWRVDVPVDLAFSDFQQVSGVLVPMKVSKFIGSSTVSEIQFQSVVFNVAIADSEFGEVR